MRKGYGLRKPPDMIRGFLEATKVRLLPAHQYSAKHPHANAGAFHFGTKKTPSGLTARRGFFFCICVRKNVGKFHKFT